MRVATVNNATSILSQCLCSRWPLETPLILRCMLQLQSMHAFRLEGLSWRPHLYYPKWPKSVSELYTSSCFKCTRIRVFTVPQFSFLLCPNSCFTVPQFWVFAVPQFSVFAVPQMLFFTVPQFLPQFFGSCAPILVLTMNVGFP